jgi:hypothetical protein
MSDLREVFPILEDPSTGGGIALTKVVEGDPASIVEAAMPALVAKNSSGSLVFLQLDSQNRLPVTSEGAGTSIRARGELSAGNATSGMVDVPGAVISMIPGDTYSQVSFIVSCTRETHAQLVFNDDGAETVLSDVILGAGMYTFESDLPKDQITAGSSGTQELKIVAKNLSKASAVRATIGAVKL